MHCGPHISQDILLPFKAVTKAPYKSFSIEEQKGKSRFEQETISLSELRTWPAPVRSTKYGSIEFSFADRKLYLRKPCNYTNCGEIFTLLVITGELADDQIFVYGQNFTYSRGHCLVVPEIGDWSQLGVVPLHSPRPKLVEPNGELLGGSPTAHTWSKSSL